MDERLTSCRVTIIIKKRDSLPDAVLIYLFFHISFKNPGGSTTDVVGPYTYDLQQHNLRYLQQSGLFGRLFSAPFENDRSGAGNFGGNGGGLFGGSEGGLFGGGLRGISIIGEPGIEPHLLFEN